MGVLETMNSVIKSCKEEAFKNPTHLQEVSHVIRDVLKKKVRTRKSNGAREVVSFIKLWLLIQYHIVDNVKVVHVKPYHIYSPLLSVKTVCQDGGNDDGDDDDQQVSRPPSVIITDKE